MMAKHRAGNYCRSCARQSVVSRRKTTAPTKDAEICFRHDPKRLRPWTPWLVLAASLAASLAAPPARSAERYNVLVLVSDDQRPDTIAALGNRHIQTPHLDRLARRGVAFTRATCGNPICTPSRAEILSGCHSFHNGVHDFGRTLEAELTLWPQAMRAAGYDAQYVGKWHNDGRPTTRGYDGTLGLFAGGGGQWWKGQQDWKGMEVTGYRGWVFQSSDGKAKYPERGVGLRPDISQDFADAAIELIGRRRDKPFFIHVNFTAPHDPLFFPPGYEDLYTGERLPPAPKNFLPRHPFDHGNIDGRDERLLPWPRTPDLVRRNLGVYYSVISHLDAQVGRILAALEASGQLERTIIVYTSDHGLAVGSHGLRGKQNMYDHTIRVPLLIAGPGIDGGRESPALCYLRDLYPTVCDLCGVPRPDNLDGESLKPLLNGRQQRVRDYVFGYFRQSQRMIRGDRWKLIEYPQARRRQLFDLDADPDELLDLSDDSRHQSTRDALSARLEQWRREAGDTP